MNLNLRNLAPLGFKSGDPRTTSTSISLLHRVKGPRVEYASGSCPNQVGYRVEYASGYCPNQLGYFDITARQLRAFRAGQLGLQPPGFCSPMGGAIVTDARVIYEGTVRSKQHLEQLFSKHTSDAAPHR